MLHWPCGLVLRYCSFAVCVLPFESAILMVAFAEVHLMLPTLTDRTLGWRSVVNVCSFVALSGNVLSSVACSTYCVSGDRFSRLLVA